MKKIFALLFLVVSLTACETEPLDPSLSGSIAPGTGTGNVTSSIVGDWLYTDLFSTATITTSFMGNTSSVVSTLEFVSSDIVTTFNTDGTYTSVGDLTVDLMVSGASQGTQTFSTDDRGTYTVTGNVLEMVSTNSGNSAAFPVDATVTIDTLTATNLVLETIANSTQTIGGATTTTVNEGTSTFVRQ